jgi:hypothetical protein
MVCWMPACRFWTLTTPSALGKAERFDKGIKSTPRAEFWTGTAPTRKGSTARTKAEEKYIQENRRSDDERKEDLGQ